MAMAALTAFLRRALPPRSTVTTANIPLWALIVIVISGTVILVTAVVLPLTILSRWRRRRNRQSGRRKRLLFIDGCEVSVYRGGWGEGHGGSADTSTETLERTGKLRKKRRRRSGEKRGRGGDNASGSGWGSSESEDGTGRSLNALGSHLSLPHVLPMIRRMSSGFMTAAMLSSLNRSLSLQQQEQGENGSGGGHTMSGAMHTNANTQQQQRPGMPSSPRRRTSNAWVDEDAIHGPQMNVGSPRKSKSSKGSKKRRRGSKGNKDSGPGGPPQQRSWRHSLRESWPLRDMSPTLPIFTAFGSPKAGEPASGGGSTPKLAEEEDSDVGVGGESLPMRPPTVHDPHAQTADVAVTFRSPHRRLSIHSIPRLIPISGGQHQQRDGAISPQYSPPRQLPKPPRQALLAANEEVAGPIPIGRGPSPIGRGPSPVGRGPSPIGRGPSPIGRGPSPIGRGPSPVGQGPKRAPVGGGVAVSGSTVPCNRGPSYWVYEDDMGGAGVVPAPLRLSTGSRNAGRRASPSSDSTLTYILQGTERRLVEGGVGGPRRSLGPSPLVVSGRDRSGTLSTGDESTLTLVGSGTATPSPTKPTATGTSLTAAKQNNVVYKNGSHYHSRDDSRDSIQSVDSFLAREPSPEGGYFQGLSSPNKGSPPRQQETTHRHRQDPLILLDSPNSGELSDLPEVDENDENTPPRSTGARPATVLDDKDHNVEDPFVTQAVLTLHESRARRVQPISRAPHAFNDAPLLEAGPGPARTSGITMSSLRSESPLSNISGNSRRNSPEFRSVPAWRTSPHRNPHPSSSSKVQTTSRGMQEQLVWTPGGTVVVYQQQQQPAPAMSAASSTANLLLHHRRNLSTVTDNEDEAASSSNASDAGSPTPKRLSQLRGQASSPTLGRRGRSCTPDMPPPSTALPPLPPLPSPRVASSYYETHSDDAQRASMALSALSASQASSLREVASSHFADFEREKPAALSRHTPLSELVQNGEGYGGRRRSQTIRLVSSDSVNAPGGVLPVVAQLRRMNSQVSGHYSDGGSSSEASTTGNTPLLPTLREEGTGRFVRPPRRREASRNYHGLERASKRVLSGDLRYGHHPEGKENVHHGDDGGDHKRMDLNGGENAVAVGAIRPGRASFLPVRRSDIAPDRSAERKNDDSEYDSDGFWMSPGMRRSLRG